MRAWWVVFAIAAGLVLAYILGAFGRVPDAPHSLTVKEITNAPQ